MCKRVSSRDKILRAAAELFYHAGYHDTTVDTILDRCGVAKSNFYYHFDSKEALAQAVLEQRIAEYESLLTHCLQQRQWTPGERIERLFEGLCAAQDEMQRMGGCPLGAFAASLPAGTDKSAYEPFRMSVSSLFRRMEDALRDTIREGIARGEFRSDLPCEDLACFVVAAIQGLLMMTKMHQDLLPLRKGLSVTCRLLKA